TRFTWTSRLPNSNIRIGRLPVCFSRSWFRYRCRPSLMGATPGCFNLEGFKINYLTPPLDTVLLVTASLYPVGFCANVTALIKGPRGFGPSQSLRDSLVGFVLGYAVILVVVALVRPQQVLAFDLPRFLPLLLLAPFVGIACILVEYLAGILLLFLRTGELVKR